MREILFKAKRINNGEWVQGWYMETFTGSALIVTLYDHILGMIEKYEVDPKTLSQYTGLKDKNGNMIFEGDIVKYNWDNAWCKNNEFHTEIRLVEYSQYGFNPFIEDYTCDDDYYSNRIDFDSIEVIGNKFNNPELLEVQDVKD